MGALDARSAVKRASTEVGISTKPMVTYGWYYRIGKPIMDRLLAALLLVLLALPVLVTALIVWFSLGRPLLFRQLRVGKDGELFRVIKFRTMGPDRRTSQSPFDGPERRRSHKRRDDPRIKGAGAFLRKWSLDELPQFWNVLRGEMSLVGPRPELPEIVSGYEEWQHLRHIVKPGITGLWQVSDRSRILHEATDLDLEYIEELSFLTDIKILLKTPISAMGNGKGF